MYKTASDTWKEDRYKRLRSARNASGEEQTCGIARYVARPIVQYVLISIGGSLGSNSFSWCKVDCVSKLLVRSDICAFIFAMANLRPAIIR